MNNAIFEYKVIKIQQKNRYINKVAYQFLCYMESYNSSLEYIQLYNKYINLYKDKTIYVSEYDRTLKTPGYLARGKTSCIRLNPLIDGWQFGETIKGTDFIGF